MSGQSIDRSSKFNSKGLAITALLVSGMLQYKTDRA